MEVMPTGHAGGIGFFVPQNPILVDHAKGCWRWDVDGYYQTFTGFALVSTAIGQQEIDGFLFALERSLHSLGYVGEGSTAGGATPQGESVGAQPVAQV